MNYEVYGLDFNEMTSSLRIIENYIEKEKENK